jgi:hypothetical protein
MIKLSEQQIIDQLSDRLTKLFAEVEPSQINRVVQEEYARFGDRPNRDFVPIFVERNAKTELVKREA